MPKRNEYIEISENQELFLRRKADYIRNCSERVKLNLMGRINIKDLASTANALIQHGEEIKKLFNLK